MTESKSIQEDQLTMTEVTDDESLNLFKFFFSQPPEGSKCPIRGSLVFLTNKKSIFILLVTILFFALRLFN